MWLALAVLEEVQRTGVNFDPTEAYNYCEIFRNTLEMSNTAQQTNLRTTEAGEGSQARGSSASWH